MCRLSCQHAADEASWLDTEYAETSRRRSSQPTMLQDSRGSPIWWIQVHLHSIKALFTHDFALNQRLHQYAERCIHLKTQLESVAQRSNAMRANFDRLERQCASQRYSFFYG